MQVKIMTQKHRGASIRRRIPHFSVRGFVDPGDDSIDCDFGLLGGLHDGNEDLLGDTFTGLLSVGFIVLIIIIIMGISVGLILSGLLSGGSGSFGSSGSFGGSGSFGSSGSFGGSGGFGFGSSGGFGGSGCLLLGGLGFSGCLLPGESGHSGGSGCLLLGGCDGSGCSLPGGSGSCGGSGCLLSGGFLSSGLSGIITTSSTDGLLPLALLVELVSAIAVLRIGVVTASAIAILVRSTSGSSTASSLARRHAQSHVGTAEHTSLTFISIHASLTGANSLRLDALGLRRFGLGTSDGGLSVAEFSLGPAVSFVQSSSTFASGAVGAASAIYEPPRTSSNPRTAISKSEPARPDGG